MDLLEYLEEARTERKKLRVLEGRVNTLKIQQKEQDSALDSMDGQFRQLTRNLCGYMAGRRRYLDTYKRNTKDQAEGSIDMRAGSA